MSDILPPKNFFRPEEVAQFFSVSVRTVYRWAEYHKIAVVTLPSGQLRIPRGTILALASPSSLHFANL